ncbi:MAG: preprotein translocase subunit YajC [Clostridia bacterium]|nr:preprotein translocase subunit YajC [Clostridia bacterium]
MSFLDALLGITTAYAENTATNAGGDPGILGTLLAFSPMLLVFVIFYFMMLRPQRKKDKQVKEMLNNLKNGDRICTIGGIYGTITGLKDDTVTLAVGNQDTHMVVARWAIRSVEEVSVENDAEALN